MTLEGIKAYIKNPKNRSTVNVGLFILLIIFAAVTNTTLAWAISDTANGLMAIPNFVALFALSPVVFKLTKEYFAKVDKEKK